ncbi:porin [beta proteobacterium AAP51]|nr:porin [beta proteobacterium AAP51]
MKKTLIVAAVSAVAATSALAQSSVTVYGRVNVTAESQKNISVVGSQKVLQNNASRLGFRGTEDLGGGLKAEFLLEHRFNVDTGTAATPFWAGDSYVGLSGGFGSVKLGRLTSAAYYATADYISYHNHDTGTSEDKLYTYLGQNANSIAYTTPSIGGLTAELSISAGEGVSTNKVTGLALNYNVGALGLGFGYEKNSGDKDSQFAIRANYEMGPVLLGGYFQRSDDKGAGAQGKRDAYRVSAMYTMGASEFHANYGSADDWSRVRNSDASQFTLGYNYNLSKRTKVYGFYTTVDNGAVSYFGFANRKATSIAAGVRHNF